MAHPDSTQVPDGRLSGEDMQLYMQKFAQEFLKDKIRYSVEVLNISRNEKTGEWKVSVEDLLDGSRSTLSFGRIVVCTGVCSFFGF